MNKIFPLLLATICFAGFLTGQLVFDYVSSNANQSSEEKSKLAHLKSVVKSLSVTTIEGKKIDLNKHPAKVKIINFWASWCTPCKEEFPSLVELSKKYSSDEVLILGINSGEEQQKTAIAKTVKEFHLNFPIVADKESEIFDKFLVSAIPVTVMYIGDEVVRKNGGTNFMDAELLKKIEAAKNYKPSQQQ